MSTCRYAGPVSGPCTRPATHLVDGQPYCTRDATAAARPGARVERIAPDPPATAPAAPPARMTSAGRAMTALTGLDSPDRQRGTCHTCGLPVDRRGECRECQ